MDIEKIIPKIGLPGGIIDIYGLNFDAWNFNKNYLLIDNKPTKILGCSNTRIIAKIPFNITGDVEICIKTNHKEIYKKLICGKLIVNGLHITDNPILDKENNIYSTTIYSKGKKIQKSLIKIDKKGKIKNIIDNLQEITSLAITNDEKLLILSNEEGNLYISNLEGKYKILTINLGKASGIVVDSNNNFYIGNIEGEVYKIQKDGTKNLFVKIPPSYLAYYLSIDTQDNLYLSNPNMIYDSKLYKISPSGNVELLYTTKSLLRGITLDKNNNIYFIESKRGIGTVYKLSKKQKNPMKILIGDNLIGLASNKNNLYIASKSAIYKLKLSQII